ncbi:hypothetical protein NRIC_14240 [Enterococcus florum]|uniref:Uncharacterized protein n=1 Tax=Enterococcus florum TaxID=2480627 RepID=A0A4P5PJM4_9ENTE|nr:hypothetical protein [Enterococcus florum]GCF93533.1 hypothetical protein NRIC_14240 [Enterococcus florum]
MLPMDWFVVGLCGLCAIISGYSILLLNREKGKRFILGAVISGIASMVIYYYYFAENEQFIFTCIYYSFWILSALFFAKRSKRA